MPLCRGRCCPTKLHKEGLAWRGGLLPSPILAHHPSSMAQSTTSSKQHSSRPPPCHPTGGDARSLGPLGSATAPAWHPTAPGRDPTWQGLGRGQRAGSFDGAARCLPPRAPAGSSPGTLRSPRYGAGGGAGAPGRGSPAQGTGRERSAGIHSLRSREPGGFLLGLGFVCAEAGMNGPFSLCCHVCGGSPCAGQARNKRSRRGTVRGAARRGRTGQPPLRVLLLQLLADGVAGAGGLCWPEAGARTC